MYHIYRLIYKSPRLISYIISTTASSFKYWVPFFMVVHLAGLNTTCSLKGYLSLMVDSNHCHMVKDCDPFPITLSMPLSLKRDPSWLASLPTKSRLLAPLCSAHLADSHNLFTNLAAHSAWAVKLSLFLHLPPAFAPVIYASLGLPGWLQTFPVFQDSAHF